MAAPDCADVLAKLYDALIALSSGQRAATISFGQRSVTYTQQNHKDLLTLYRQHYRMCGANSGYPDLASPIERGPPIVRRMA